MTAPQNITPIPLVFSANDRYAELLGVALCSLWENKAADTQLEIHVLDGGLSTDSKRLLEILEKKYNFNINYLPIDLNLFAAYPEPDQDRLRLPTYSRLWAPQLIQRGKIIYLDCDLVILKDLTPLFNEDLGDNIFGASADSYEGYGAISLKNKSAFNAGVLVINCQLWRARNLTAAATEFIQQNKDKITLYDQEALQFIGRDHYKILAQKYNRQLYEYSRRLRDDETFIMHYINKPNRFMDCGRNAYQYQKYLEKTPWRNSRRPDKNLKNRFRKAIKIILLRLGVLRPGRDWQSLKKFKISKHA